MSSFPPIKDISIRGIPISRQERKEKGRKEGKDGKEKKRKVDQRLIYFRQVLDDVFFSGISEPRI